MRGSACALTSAQGEQVLANLGFETNSISRNLGILVRSFALVPSSGRAVRPSLLRALQFALFVAFRLVAYVMLRVRTDPPRKATVSHRVVSPDPAAPPANEPVKHVAVDVTPAADTSAAAALGEVAMTPPSPPAGAQTGTPRLS